MKAVWMSRDWVRSGWYSGLNSDERDLWWFLVSVSDICGMWEVVDFELQARYKGFVPDMWNGPLSKVVKIVGKWVWMPLVLEINAGKVIGDKAPRHVKIRQVMIDRGFDFSGDFPVWIDELGVGGMREDAPKMPNYFKGDGSSKQRRPRNIDQVRNFGKNQGLTDRAEDFWDHYEARGWKGIESWHAAYSQYSKRGDAMERQQAKNKIQDLSPSAVYDRWVARRKAENG